MPSNPMAGSGWMNNLAAAVNAVVKCATFTYDTAGFDTAGVDNKTVAAHPTPVKLPANAIVMGGFFDVNTVFTSTGGNGTLAISVEAANDIQTATSIAGAPYSTIGRKAITPKFNTPESTSIKTSVERAITVTVAVNAMLTGKLTGYLFYVEGVVSA